jgi:hypothetical protein
MAVQTKAQRIAVAWAEYRAASQAIPRTLPFAGFKRGGVYREGFLEQDERLYVATERAILADKEAP